MSTTPDKAELEALAERVEQATAEEQREMLWLAFCSLYPPPAGVCVTSFLRKLDAEAYESAAMMLVPVGWVWTIHTFAIQASAFLMNERDEQVRTRRQYIATPALALTAACLRSHASKDI